MITREKVLMLRIGDRVLFAGRGGKFPSGTIVTVRRIDFRETTPYSLLCGGIGLTGAYTYDWLHNEDLEVVRENEYNLIEILNDLHGLSGKIFSSPNYGRQFTVRNGVLCYADNFELTILDEKLTQSKFTVVTESEPKFQYTLNKVYLNQLGVKPVWSTHVFLNAHVNKLGNLELTVDTSNDNHPAYQTWFTDKEFEELEDVDNIKHLFNKVVRQEES